MNIKFKNLIFGVVFQISQPEFYVNKRFRQNMRGIFHINSHIAKNSKTPKQTYGHYETALRAAGRMHEKTGKEYRVYKCIYCDSWHIGKPR